MAILIANQFITELLKQIYKSGFLLVLAFTKCKNFVFNFFYSFLKFNLLEYKKINKKQIKISIRNKIIISKKFDDKVLAIKMLALVK